MPNTTKTNRCDICDAEFEAASYLQELCPSCQEEENDQKAFVEQKLAAEAIVKNTTPEGVHPYDPDVVERRRQLIQRSRSSVRRGFSIS
jgi:phage FluMu protein Com